LRLKRYSDQLKARAYADGLIPESFSGDQRLVEPMLPSVMIVEDSPADAKLFKSLLNSLACSMWIVQSGEEALSICNNHDIDIIILDIILPGMDGYDVVKQIKENRTTQSTQIIAVTSLQGIESKIKGFDCGVDDYLVKPINFDEFRARVNSLIKKKAYFNRLMTNYEAAVQAAITDRLTGVYNKGYFQHYLKNELRRADRQSYPISILMLDVDDFKQINDRCGHLAGDRLLKAITEKLQQNLREIDVLTRFGGDEFAIVMPYTQKEEAAEIAERIRVLLETSHVEGNDEGALKLSISIGAADYTPGLGTAQDLIQKADKALCAAKMNGKNRVCLAPHSAAALEEQAAHHR
jgi:two-component system cell cycle response regulator